MSAPTIKRGGRAPVHTPEQIVEILREYAGRYGEDALTASAFSPSVAKWRDDPIAAERYYAGRSDGGTWPSLNTIKKAFDGSFNAARVAAGFAANKPGPSTRRRAAGAAAPVRDVSHAKSTRIVYRDKVGTEDLRARMERAELNAARLRHELEMSRAAKRVTQRKVVVNVVDDTKIKAAQTRAEKEVQKAKTITEQARVLAAASKEAEREAKAAATKMAARLERAEATISTLREERKDQKLVTDREADLNVALEAELDTLKAELESIKGDVRIEVRDAPEQAAVDQALMEAETARQEARRSELRAARAERLHAQVAAAATGQARVLTQVEINELRRKGPVGPGPLGEALKELARSRNPTSKQVALTKVASEAVSWRESL